MGVPILLHPAYPMTYDAVKGRSLVGGLGLMFDTTIALARIILSGILDRHPRLKLLCPHVGGALPYLIGRMDHQTQVLKRGAENISRPPSEYLRQIYLDTVSPIALAIRYGYDFAGPDRLLYASDHPWVDPDLIVSKIDSPRPAGRGSEEDLHRQREEALPAMNRAGDRSQAEFETTTPPDSSKYQFHLAVCSGTFHGWSFAEACKGAVRTGYEGIEIAPHLLSDDPNSLSADRRRELRDIRESEGLLYVGMHNMLKAPGWLHLTTPDRTRREKSWDYFRGLVDLGGDLGDGGLMILGSARQRGTVDGATRREARGRMGRGSGCGGARRRGTRGTDPPGAPGAASLRRGQQPGGGDRHRGADRQFGGAVHVRHPQRRGREAVPRRGGP